MKFFTPEISWHNRDPLYSVDLQLHQGKIKRLATCGTDKLVRMWEVKFPQEENVDNATSTKEHGSVTVDFLSSLNRHSRTVNVVRFSPDGAVLASGADDSAIILWRLSDVPPSASLFQEDEEENRETWNAFKVLRSHLEDVYDICWSSDSKMLISGSVDNTAILWDVKKGHKLWMFSEHKSFVQGVAFDPLCGFIATMSDDRSCRIYSFEKRQLVHDVRKLPASFAPATLLQADDPAPTVANKTIRMFHSADTMKSFFRRLSFSPDGRILVVPAGCIEAAQSTDSISNTTFVFSRSNLSRPVMSLVGPSKPTLAVRFCPLLFELRKIARRVAPEKPADAIESEIDSKENELEWVKYETLFKLPYRMVYAVLSENAVFLYDTQQPQPIAYMTNLHYHTLSDATWSQDGRLLVLSSTDGYCTLVSFDSGELGIAYKHQVSEVLMQSVSVKEEAEQMVPTPTVTSESKPNTQNIIAQTVNNVQPVSQPAPLPSKSTVQKPAQSSVIQQLLKSSAQQSIKSDVVQAPSSSLAKSTANQVHGSSLDKQPAKSGVSQPVKSTATKPVKRCITTLLSSSKSPAAAGTTSNKQTTNSLPPKCNLLQPTVNVRLLPRPTNDPIVVIDEDPDVMIVEPTVTNESEPVAVAVTPESVEVSMDIGEDQHSAVDASSKTDDVTKRLSVEHNDFHLQLELTNDACGVSAVTSSAPHVSPSFSVPSDTAAGSQPPSIGAAAVTSPAAGKNPRRIQLTTITSLR